MSAVQSGGGSEGVRRIVAMPLESFESAAREVSSAARKFTSERCFWRGTMNKSELIERLSQRCEMGTVQAEDVVKLMIDRMRQALLTGKRIEIRGFGSFMVKEYGSYQGRNPKTSDNIWVKEKKLPVFKAGKELRERLNAGVAGDE